MDSSRFSVLDANGALKTTGARGATGAAGSNGSNGTDGDDGATGATGPSGRVTLFDSTLGAAAATIDTGAAGIAAGSNHLEITILARSDEAVVGATLTCLVNNDTGSNYDRQAIRGDSTVASAVTGNAQANWPFVIAGASCGAGVFSVLQLIIPCYTQTVAFKTGICSHARVDTTAANSRMEIQGCLWRSTAAITRFSVTALATKLLLAGSRLLIVGL